MDEIIQEGKTREEAVSLALQKLGVGEDEVEVEELEGQRDRFFGLLSSKTVKVRVAVRQSPERYVKEFVLTVLEKMEVRLTAEVERYDEEIVINLDGDDAGMIIGKFGQTLDSLQYLANVIAGKHSKDNMKVVLNVGDYRERREESLRRMARAMASKVVKSRKEVVLAPMSPQDRRIVHIALSNFRGVSTSSEGVGPNRRVIISYNRTPARRPN